MKKIIALSTIIFLTAHLFGQSPHLINYQGIARNSSGAALGDQNIKLRLSIRSGSANGNIVYQETRTLKTNSFGMFVVAIGSNGASNIVGAIANIDWSIDGAKFLQVELDAGGGNNFTDMGSSQLLSVPYALHAASASIPDSTVTLSKLAPGIIPTIPTTLPPSGAAGGDLTGSYPNPSIANGVVTTSKIADSSITAAKLAPGLIIGGGGGGNFSLPFSGSAFDSSSVFSITNTGPGNALLGSTINGTGVKGISTNGYGVYAQADGDMGISLFATSNNGIPAYIDISNSESFFDALFVNNSGYGSGITTIASSGNGLLGIANNAAGAAVIGVHNASGEAVVGRTFSDMAAGVVGRNDGTYAGVRGYNVIDNGTGILAQANVDGAVNGTALVAELQEGEGNTAVFKAGGANVARIDHTGKGYFNGGTVAGGADVAEYFEVNGNKKAYEPGDVLIISQNSDRKVEKSCSPYSTLVAGVYATKPGLYLTEENAVQNRLDHMVPMGVIGVIPTKVCLEGGAIKRGDMLVTSSILGVAMKADPAKVKVGQVIGKALQNFDSNGIGKINVLVSVK